MHGPSWEDTYTVSFALGTNTTRSGKPVRSPPAILANSAAG